jgi:hypothetical protein
LFGDRRIPHPSTVLHFALEFTAAGCDLPNGMECTCLDGKRPP